MPVISDINPNSLGPLQPIRAPQVPVSIPNPLSVAPFFQGQQLQQNERRLDQQDIAMALQEKQFDLAMSELVFRQTKEILDMGDMSVENAYNEHTSRQSSQGGSGYGSQLGLDMGYKKHVELAEKANSRIGDFESKMLSGLAGTLKGGDPKGMNMLLADLSKGLIENRRALQNDPEYIKYAVQHQKFNRFLKGTAAEIAKGNSVDELQYRRTEQLYKKFADGDHLTLRETQELDELLSNSNIQAMTFNQEKGLKWLKETIDAAAAPILEEEGIDTNDPRLPGYGIVKSKKTWADPADVMHEVVRAAAVNEDLIKMFKAATGLDIRDKKNYGAFANWVAVQAKPYLHPGGQFTTDVGAVIVDPTEVLKSRAAARGTDSTTTGSPFTGNTESERQADRYYNDLLNKGLEIPLGELSDVAAIAALKANNPGSILEETDPNTGEVKVWRVKVDAQGNPITEVKYDADNKEIPNSEHIVKVGQPLLVLQKRKTVSSTTSPNTSTYGDYAVVVEDGIDGTNKTAVPAIDNAGLTVQRVAQLRKQGLKHPVVRLGENRDQSNTATSPAGDKGLFQFNPESHLPAFLKSINQPDWDTALAKLGDEEFRRLQEEYYDKEIFTPAINKVQSKLNKALPDAVDITKDGYWEGVREYIGSTANQSGGWETIVDNAIKRLFTDFDEGEDLENAKSFLKLLQEERTKYIMKQGPTVRTKAGLTKPGQWEEAGINRPFRDYIGSLAIMQEYAPVPELDNILRGGTPVVESQAATLPSASSIPVSPQQVEAQVMDDDANLHPAIKRVQGVYLSGQKPSPAKMMEFINEAGLITPDREITSPSRLAKLAGVTTSGPSEITRANEALQRAENDLQLIENKIKEESKASQRRGEGVIVKETDPRYIKAANAVDVALGKREDLAYKFADEADAILKAEAFPTEAKEAYKLAANYLADAIGFTTKYDLDGINPELEGTIIEYEDDPGVFSLQEKGKKERDITLKELAEWIEDNAKAFAFKQTDPVELRRAKMAQIQVATQQPAAPTSAVRNTTTQPLSSQDKINKLRGGQ